MSYTHDHLIPPCISFFQLFYHGVAHASCIFFLFTTNVRPASFIHYDAYLFFRLEVLANVQQSRKKNMPRKFNYN